MTIGVSLGLLCVSLCALRMDEKEGESNRRLLDQVVCEDASSQHAPNMLAGLNKMKGIPNCDHANAYNYHLVSSATTRGVGNGWIYYEMSVSLK